MPTSSNPVLKHKKILTRSDYIEQLIALTKIACNQPSQPLTHTHPLCQLILELLQVNKDSILLDSLDNLWEQDTPSYELLAEYIESCVQSTVNADGKISTLFAIPILVWSSHNLPCEPLSPTILLALKQALKQYWLNDSVDCYISNTVYMPDHLPDNFYDTYGLSRHYFEQSMHSDGILLSKRKVQSKKIADVIHQADEINSHAHTANHQILADNRFILVVLSHLPDINPLKLLLDNQGLPNLALQESMWHESVQALFTAYFIGCTYDILVPQPYYEANRNAELAIRGFSLHAAVLTLMTQMDITADDLRVVIGACHQSQFEEYRISILLKDEEEVLQGVAWALLGRDEQPEDLLAEILVHLKKLGINRIRLLEDILSIDYCEDCETPLFPDMSGDMVHISPLEDDSNPSRFIVH